VCSGRAAYDPFWYYAHQPETREALDLIVNDHFSPDEPGIFLPIPDSLFAFRDYHMHMADPGSYADAQGRFAATYANGHAWAQKAILNVVCSGFFSSDRTITEYATEIWDARPSPVP
jgi:starch phosphorylase